MRKMPGRFYCDGQISNCPYKEQCYKTGGTCFATEDRSHAAKEKPEEISIMQREQYIRYEQKEKAEKKPNEQRSGPSYSSLVLAAVSIIVSFVVALITILVKM